MPLSLDRPIITLTTDFGSTDPYVGVMKGVILGINPLATLVDITHQVAPQNIIQGAFLLGKSYRYFPAHAIHLAVVDPGVGSSRRSLILETPRGRFVAPDNGVLSYVLQEEGLNLAPGQEGPVPLPPEHRAYVLTNPRYWLHPLSSTFHGRDVFAPVAARLSLRTSPQEMGEETNFLSCLPVAVPTWEGDRLRAQVVHIDRFGNLVTNVPTRLLAGERPIEVRVRGHRIQGVSSYYVQGRGLMALMGSFDTLEVALRNGNASAELGAAIGDDVEVTRGPGD
jgi:S-adenosylmethionine hydrolase